MTAPRALVLSPDTAFGQTAGQTLAGLGCELGTETETPSVLLLSPWTSRGGDALAESRAHVGDLLAAAGRHAPGCGLIIHPLSLRALAPFGDETDFPHRAALAAAQLNRAWCAPLGVRVAQLFIDRLDIATNRVDHAAPLADLDLGLRHVLAGADEAFCDPAAQAVWDAINGDW